MVNRLRWLVIVGAVMLVIQGASVQSNAQTYSTLLGRVTDQTRAVVPGVKLTLQNVATDEVRTASTSSVGMYTFALLPPGTYVLTAAKSGFATVAVKNLIINVNSQLRHDITMPLQRVTQQVNVTANLAVVNTETASLGNVIGTRQIVDLPLNGRDFMQLATLSAGVSPPATQNGESTTQGLSGGRPTLTVSISGSREISPAFLFDGIPSKQFFYGAVGIEPPVDSIAEFKIQRGFFSPQFGLPAVINVVTKSGTNSLHGAVWEFFRNDALDTRNFFDVNRPPYRQNQYGFNAGGPAIKNKLFWFGDFEGLDVRQSGTSSAIVPTTAELQGSFSGSSIIYNPATYNAATNSRQPFSGNTIPSALISPFASKYLRFIPAPNTAPIAALGGANLIGETLYSLDDRKFDVRADYSPREKDRLFSRFTYDNSGQTSSSLFPFGGTISPLDSRNAVLGWTHVFNPTLVNDVRIGLDRSFLNSATPKGAASNPDWPKLLGLTNLNQVPACNGVPAVGMVGLSTFGFSFANCIITGNNDIVIRDNLSFVHGRHNLTMGFGATHNNWRIIGSFTQNGSLTFTGQFTGNPATNAPGNSVADFLLGDPFSVSGEKPTEPTYREVWWPDTYINDDYHIRPNFTINIGLRWQFTPPPPENHNNLFALNYRTGQQVRCGTNGLPRGCLSSQYADFAPRLGLAYSPRKQWAIRTSYGRFFDRLPGNEWVWNSIGPPFLVGYSAVSDPNIPTIDIGTLFPTFTPNLQGASLFDLANRVDPVIDQWTFSVQRSLPGSVLVEAAYVGSKGTYLSKRVDANLDATPGPGSVQARRPLPQWGFILSDQGRGNSEYDSLQISVRKETSHGFTFLSGYTWGKSLDNDSYDGKATRNYMPYNMDKGRSIFDLRNRFTASAIYDFPFGQGLSGAAKELVAGWEVDAIVGLQSGLPFQVTTRTDFSNTGAFWIPRPNRVCDGNLPVSQRSPHHWFNTACFVNPPLYTYGNGGVAYLDTDGTKDVDLALIKNFPIRETRRLQFRAEVFNSFNNVNFGRPGSTLGTSRFGVVTSAGAGRIIQFALKFLF